MSDWLLENSHVAVGVQGVGAQLWPVRFRGRGGWLEPMHRAHWRDEPGVAAEPMLQNLQGDFFCAPFGDSDVLADEARSHGAPANGEWRPLDASQERLLLELAASVSGAKVSKELRIAPGQPVIYQTHRFAGGQGELPMGHHAMLRAPEGERLRLSFSPFAWAGTPPQPVEADPARGRSALLYPQRIVSLQRVRTVHGEFVDLSGYPTTERSEDIVMLVTDPAQPFAWSAAVAPESGWIWFGMRPNGVLRNTLLWLSNGGRDYPPFSGRHQRVLGLEEMTGYFHLGHRASLERNGLSESGYPTAVELKPDGEVITRYALGAVPAPAGFDRVVSVELGAAELIIAGAQGAEVRVPFDVDFLTR